MNLKVITDYLFKKYWWQVIQSNFNNQWREFWDFDKDQMKGSCVSKIIIK